jgi:glycosyltransferase involved in cell wall biosynthesis
MRIAVLAWESVHSIMVGGLAVVVSRHAEALAKLGHEVHLFTRRGEGQSDSEYINGHYYHRCTFDTSQNLLAFAHNMSKSFVARLHEVERTYGRFDIIHGHDWHVVDAIHDLRSEERVVILTFHSTEYGRNGGKFGDWWEFKEVSGKEWYGGYIANRITTVSNTMMNELSWLYKISPDKIVVIPNAIDHKKFQMNVDPGRIKEKYGIHPLTPTVLFLGRIVNQKGPDLLVEAIPKVLSNRWDVKFIFAGDGGMKAHLQNRVVEFGVEGSTKFLGWVPFPSLIELLNSVDIVCIPSRNEPFGVVLLEAWVAGRPVVATDVGGLGENIENFVDGVKVYPHPDSVAWGINYLFSNPDILRRISENGRKKVQKFTWNNVAKQLVKTYKLALDR